MTALASLRRSHRLAVLGAVFIAAAGCGGKVVLDASHGGVGGSTVGAGGAATAGPGGNIPISGFGGTTTTGFGGTGLGGTTTTGFDNMVTSSSGGVECSGTYAELESDVAAAQACNPMDDFIQCTGKHTVFDECGCQVVANDGLTQAIAAALSEWMTCVSMGCCGPTADPISPPACNPCPSPPVDGACDPMTDQCVPAFGTPPPPRPQPRSVVRSRP